MWESAYTRLMMSARLLHFAVSMPSMSESHRRRCSLCGRVRAPLYAAMGIAGMGGVHVTDFDRNRESIRVLRERGQYAAAAKDAG